MVRLIAVSLAAVALASACSNGKAAFALTSASADASHWCPGGVEDSPYDVHATVAVHNGTPTAVTIKAVSARMTLESVGGTWLEKVGAANTADATFSPTIVKAGTDAALKVTFRSSCTSPAYGSRGGSYGDYRIDLKIATSTGAFTIATSGLHRILTA